MGHPNDINKPIDLRTGVDVDGFLGVQTEKDPGAIPRNAFQRAYNVRVRAGMPISRGGQSKILTTPINSAWDGLCDVQGGANDGTLRLYVSGVSFSGPLLLWPGSITGYSPTFDDNPVAMNNDIELDALIEYNRSLIAISSVIDPTAPIGYEVTINGTTATLNEIFQGSFTGDHVLQSSIVFDGDLYLAYGQQSEEESQTLVWDGATLSVSGVLGGGGSVLATNTSDVYIYATDSSGLGTERFFRLITGTWTAITAAQNPPFRPVGSVNRSSIAYWVGSNGTNVLLMSATGSTVATVATKSPGAGPICLQSVCLFGTKILWIQGVDNNVMLCSWDGGSVVEEFNFTTGLGWATADLIESGGGLAPRLTVVFDSVYAIWRTADRDWFIWKSRMEYLDQWIEVQAIDTDSMKSGLQPVSFTP